MICDNKCPEGLKVEGGSPSLFQNTAHIGMLLPHECDQIRQRTSIQCGLIRQGVLVIKFILVTSDGECN